MTYNKDCPQRMWNERATLNCEDTSLLGELLEEYKNRTRKLKMMKFEDGYKKLKKILDDDEWADVDLWEDKVELTVTLDHISADLLGYAVYRSKSLGNDVEKVINVMIQEFSEYFED